MKIQEEYPQLFERSEADDSVIVYIPKFREFGLCVLESGTRLRESVFEQIFFCPYTGKRLPASLRDAWFEKLDEMGLEPESKDLPEEMKTDKWWLQLSGL